MYPLLTIITVAAAETQRLQKTLLSINPHLSSKIEHLVIVPNDDSSRSLLDSIEFKSPFRKIINDKGTGIYPAMNIGLTQSTGKYCWFINAGDQISRTSSFPSSLLNQLYESEAIVICEATFDWRAPQDNNLDNVAKFCVLDPSSFISHQTVIALRAQLLELGGFNEKYKVASDTQLLIRAFENRRIIWNTDTLIKVEAPNFASQFQRRSRFETFLIAMEYPIMRKKLMISNILKREFQLVKNRF